VAAHLDPEVLIVDEVLAVGDASFQKKCLGKMGDVVKEGRTVIFVSHNMEAVGQLCSHTVLINAGRSSERLTPHTSQTLDRLGIAHESKVVSAHRTPDRLFAYAESAAARGLQVIIAGAGGAAHLPGMVASKTRIPVVGVPVQSKALSGIDSLLSIAQMPAGVPVACMAIGKAGAINAALFAAAILALGDTTVAAALDVFRQEQTDTVLSNDDPRTEKP
jgi:5-(carboxyamino)imidazole ribonucleotide mutase